MLRSHDLVQDVRKYVFVHFLEYSVPPVAEQIMKRFHLGRPQALEVLRALETGRHVRLVPGTQRILMAWPFSAVATPRSEERRVGKECRLRWSPGESKKNTLER